MPGINGQPPRRPGMAGKRYGMLVDMRKCIGCQSCTVSCSLENQPPVGQFRTTVLQYEVVPDQGQAAMVMLPRRATTATTRPACRSVGAGHLQREDGIVLVDNELRGLRLLRAGLSV